MFQALLSHLRNRTLALTAAGVAAFGLVAPASAQFEEEDFSLRLDGFAQTDVNVSGTDLSIGASLGYFFTDQWEVGLRQTYSYTDINADASAGSTAIYTDYHIGDPGSEWQPFIGLSLGFNYGDNVHDSFFGGPQGGLKYFVSDDWFIVGQIEYQFFFDDADTASESFDDGSFLFRLGIGVLL